MSTIKNAKYRIKDENEVYQTVHFETSMEQVVGLEEKVTEVEGLIADRYTKAQSDEMFRSVGAEISDVETMANGLASKIAVAEGDINTLKEGLANEIARAEGVEADLQAQIDGLEGNVADLRGEDARLASEIQNIKDVIANQGSDTKVFATMDEFLAADLSPKVGNLAFIIQNKRAYIYKGEDAPAGLDLPNPPAGWVLFDEISSTIDLVDYAKKAEVEALIAVLDAKVVAETERAQGAEQALNAAIDALKLVVAGNGEKITALEGTVAAQGGAIEGLTQNTYTKEEVSQIVDNAVTAQMSYMGKVKPADKKVGHIWIELL